MIDFRYHLVSLISVFLALAVGIALGAGPLQGAIGDTLTGQVEQLRTERAELRHELEMRQAELGRTRDALDAVAPELLADVLGGRRVALVQVAEVDADVLQQVSERIEQAGGSVSAVVQVAGAWTDPAREDLRTSAADALRDSMTPGPADGDAADGAVLADALVRALGTADPADPDAPDADAVAALAVLLDGGLARIDGELSVPADAVVVLAGPTTDVQEVAAAEAQLQERSPEEVLQEQERQDAVAEVVEDIGLAAQRGSLGAVVAGGGSVQGSVVQRLRVDEAVRRTLSTVEGVHDVTGQVAVPLALAARIAGQVGHYGPGPTAVAAMPPRVELPPVERVPDGGAPGDPGTGETDDGGPGTGDEGTGDEGTAAGTDR